LRAIKVRASPGQRETLTSCFYKDSFTADKLSRLVEMKTTAMVLVLAMSSIIGFSQHALGASSTNVEEYTAKYPYVFHLIQKSMWEEALANDATYYPPTYSHDKFSHATANPDFLMIIGNHFYPEVAGEWLCLRMSIDSLHASGVETIFETTAPVGDKQPDFPGADSELFPHILGGIHPSAVLEAHVVSRDAQGTFLAVAGIVEAK
jgi:uncharacterized protein (DUF952 family)